MRSRRRGGVCWEGYKFTSKKCGSKKLFVGKATKSLLKNVEVKVTSKKCGSENFSLPIFPAIMEVTLKF